jgi:hypothetical protein
MALGSLILMLVCELAAYAVFLRSGEENIHG